MSLNHHGLRIFLLMVGVGGLFGWLNYRSEVTFADGLRSIEQAEKIDRGAWAEGVIRSVDHPVHPLAIASIHRVLGGVGPASWQRAAQATAILGMVLLVIPVYLLTLEVFGPSTAWISCLLVIVNPVLGNVVINVLSETTFLLFWTWGLWAAVRFLREGRFVWLPPTISLGALAYVVRPEGMLLPLALVVTLLVLPLHRATRINWPRWWAAVAFLVVGSVCLVGPYVAVKGGIGTRPSIARLIGTAPIAAADALERDQPLPADQTTLQTYGLAIERVLRAFEGAVTLPLLALVVLGMAVAWPWGTRARIWLFGAVIIVISAVGLVRLHATGGYCTVRHALVPAMLLRLAAAHGIAWLIRSIVIEGRWLGLAEGRFRPGPAIWALLLGGLVGYPFLQSPNLVKVPGSFASYRDAGSWLAQVTPKKSGKVLDMTDWALFFSEQPGFSLRDVHWATLDPNTRWIVARQAHFQARWRYGKQLQSLVQGRPPVVSFPAHPQPGQLQVRIYDRWTEPPANALVRGSRDADKAAPRR